MAGQSRDRYVQFRIFIFGVEVTEDVTQYSYTRTDKRQPGTADIVLANPSTRPDGERYKMTTTDILAISHALNDYINLDLYPSFVLDDQQTDTSAISIDVNSVRQQTRNYGQALMDTQAADRLSIVIDHLIDPVKRNIVARKVFATEPTEQPAIGVTGDVSSLSAIQKIAGLSRRFPWQVSDCVFHSNDAVRIFEIDPDDPNIWHYAFSGYVTNRSFSRDASGASTCTIKCEDALRAIRFARVTFNPGIFDIQALAQLEDAFVRTFFNEGLTDLTLEEFMFTILFGAEASGTLPQIKSVSGQTSAKALQGLKPASLKRYGANAGPSDGITQLTGVGSLDLDNSIVWVYGQDATNTSGESILTNPGIASREVRVTGQFALQAYQNFVDSVVRSSDPGKMRLAGTGTAPVFPDSDSVGTSTVNDVVTEIGSYPQYYPIDHGRLIMLIPASLGSDVARSVLLKDLVQSVATQTTFRTRLQMIYDICDRLEFSFYASPRGDFICEMPLYDFDPGDFGAPDKLPTDNASVFGSATTASLERDNLENANIGNSAASFPLRSARDRRARNSQRGIALAVSQGALGQQSAFKRDYVVGEGDIGQVSSDFDDERVRTQFASPWYVVPGYESLRGATSTEIGQAPAVVTLRGLVPQFGVRLEMAEPHGFIASKQAAAVYCNLKLNQWNSDALKLSFSCLPRPRYIPNRPLLIESEQRIVTTRSVTTSVVVGSSYDCRIEANYTRGWDGTLGEDGDPAYQPIGGQVSTALNYPALLGSSRIRKPSPTVRPAGPETAKPPVKKVTKKAKKKAPGSTSGSVK